VIDVRNERMMRLADVGSFINKHNPPNISTIWRWALYGIGRNGQKTKLETIKLGGIRFSSAEAIVRFLAKLNEPGSLPELPSKAAERAGEKLRCKGA